MTDTLQETITLLQSKLPALTIRALEPRTIDPAFFNIKAEPKIAFELPEANGDLRLSLLNELRIRTKCSVASDSRALDGGCIDATPDALGKLRYAAESGAFDSLTIAHLESVTSERDKQTARDLRPRAEDSFQSFLRLANAQAGRAAQKGPLNAKREDNRTEADIAADIYRDSERIIYNPNCSMPETGRAEIARALDAYFKERDIDPAFLEYHFSNSQREDHAEFGRVHDKGVHIGFSDHCTKSTRTLAQMSVVSEEIMDFAIKNPLEGFKTYLADNDNHTGKTWEDVVAGLNRRFEMLGSKAAIDTAICKPR